MKYLIIGDLHYPLETRFYNYIQFLKHEQPDLILICGDITNYFSEINMHLFLDKTHEANSAQIIAVMGNHDFWLLDPTVPENATSWYALNRYRHIFKMHGDVLLWEKPYIIDNIGIVGVPGWFDFSFAPWNLGFTREDFENGVFENEVWRDVRATYFLMKHEEVTKINVKLLKRQLQEVSKMDLDKVIVLLHFVPLREFVPQDKDKKDMFWNAYYGSELLGETIMKFKDIVSYVFFGHLSPHYLTTKKLTKNGVPFETVDITDSMTDFRILEIS